MPRFNFKFATVVLLAAVATGGAGYGLYWWSNRKSPAKFEADGDREAAKAEALFKANEFAKADAAYIAACIAYGRALQVDMNRTATLEKFRRLTISLYSPTAPDATGWIIQHMVVSRQVAKMNPSPMAWRDFYEYMIGLAKQSRSPQLLDAIRQVAHENLTANPDDATARLYRGVCNELMLATTLPAGWETDRSVSKELQLFYDSVKQSAHQDLDAICKADPTNPVAAAHRALLCLCDIQALPDKDRQGEAAKQLATQALASVAPARAALPADPVLAAVAARVAYTAAPLTGSSPDATVREALKLALANPAALSPDLARDLCLVACHALTTPVKTGDDGARTEGQRGAMALAKAQWMQHPGAPQSATLGWVQSFSAAHAAAIATLTAGLAASDRLTVADRLAYDCMKPEMLFLLAHTQLNQAVVSDEAQRAKLAADARDTLRRLRLLNDPQFDARILLVEAQELHLKARHEEAAGRFDRALRLNPGLASPSILRAAALCHSRCGNLGAAAELLQSALRLEPADLQSRRLLALVLLQMGATEEAIKPHLAFLGPNTTLAGDLALRGGRFWEAAQAYGDIDSMAILPKRADALRATGRADQARQEILAFLHAGQPSAKRVLLACRALEEADREPLIEAVRETGGLSDADAAKVREALAGTAPADDDPVAAGVPLPPEGRAALAAWRKNDWTAFEKAAKEGGAACLEHPEILSRRIELSILRRAWEEADRLADRAEQLSLDLPLGSTAAVRATIVTMRALETGSPSLDEAQKQLREVAEDSPASTRLWMLLANLCLANGQAGQAAHAAVYACRLQPHRADCRQMLFQCRLRGGDIGAALADLRQSVKDYPFTDELRELWVASEEAVGNPALAEETRLARAKAVPKDLYNALRLAGLFARDGKPGEARTLLLSSAANAAGNPDYAMRVAAALSRAGYPEDGRAALKHLLTGRFQPWLVALWAAQLEETIGDAGAETAAWQTALNLEPTDTRPTSMAYANSLIAAGRPQDAAGFLKALLLQIAPDSKLRAPVQGILARALAQAGDFDGAEAIAKTMPEADAAVTRSSTAILRGNDTDALRFGRQAAALDPDAVNAFVSLGLALASDPLREREARDAAARALALAPAHAGARHLEAMLDAQAGRYSLAINRLWRNLAINPNHAPSFSLLTELLFQEKEDRSVLGSASANPQSAPAETEYLRAATRATLERFRVGRMTGYRADEHLASSWASGFQSQAFARCEMPIDAVAMLGILVETGRAQEALDMLGRLTQDTRVLPPLTAMRALALARTVRREEAPPAFAQALRACRDQTEIAECLRLLAEAFDPPRALAIARETLGDARPAFARLGLAGMAMRWHLAGEVPAELAPLLEDAAFAKLPEPARARVLSLQAGAESQLEHAKAAAARYRAALALAPGDLVTLNNLADLLLHHPELAASDTEAMDAAGRATFMAARAAAQGRIPRRELASIRDTLALALAKQGRREEAMTLYRSVLDIFPIPESHLHLGLLLAEEKQTSPARHHFEEAAKIADLTGQQELAAEARWRLDPALFLTNLTYAETLADLSPDRSRAMATTCADIAGREMQPAPALARFMRLCVKLWPGPKAGAECEGWAMAADLSAHAVRVEPEAAPYRLLHALALEHLGHHDWNAELDRALTRWSAQAAIRWQAPMPRALPLPEIAGRAAVLQLPPTPWPLARESAREIPDLLALAPESKTLDLIAAVLKLQQEDRHDEALSRVRQAQTEGRESGTILRRLMAASFMAKQDWTQAAGQLEALAASGEATAADRIRLLGLFTRLGRPAAASRTLAEQLLVEDPHCAAAREFLGDLALAAKDYATAEAQYGAVSPTELPAAPAICVKRAFVLRELGRRPEADAVLENGLNHCGADPWILEAYLKIEPSADSRLKAFHDACGRGLDPDLALAFAHLWSFPLKAQSAHEEQKKDAPPAPQEK